LHLGDLCENPQLMKRHREEISRLRTDLL
jgi:hypothetical protein